MSPSTFDIIMEISLIMVIFLVMRICNNGNISNNENSETTWNYMIIISLMSLVLSDDFNRCIMIFK